MKTEDLIESLARELEPVAPLMPGRRAGIWAAGAVLYVALLALAMVWLSDDSLGPAASWLTQSAAIATALLASWAAFLSVVPAAPSGFRIGAALAAGAWLASFLLLSPGPLDWSAVAPASQEWRCVGFMVIAGAPLAAALWLMLRRGAPLHPATTAAFAVLAVGAIANVGACLSLPHPNGAVAFSWHGGIVLVSMVLAAAGARYAFAWRLGRR